MKLFRFDREVGRTIDAFQSSGFVISRVVHLSNETTIHCAYLDANGSIGYHPATNSQLFLVVQGQGWVRDESSERTLIKEGQAAYWDKDEWHESGTETGLVAIIVEGVNVDPAKLMPPV